MNHETTAIELFRSDVAYTIGRPPTNWNPVLELLKIWDFPRDKMIVRENQELPYEIFLTEGVIRSYLITDEKQEVNLNFYHGPQIISPYFIRNANDKHLFNFRTLTKCTMIVFESRAFSELFSQYNDIREYAFKVAENELKFRALKEKSFMSNDAKGKLQFFRENFSGLENIIPLHHVASYLGISQVSLSRLRAKL